MENIRITTFDEALVHLKTTIDNIATRATVNSLNPDYDKDDITQECWLKVFEVLTRRGPQDLAALVVYVQHTQKAASFSIASCGLTPGKRSKFERPKQVPYEEPTAKQDVSVRDLTLLLGVIELTENETLVIEAMESLIETNDAVTNQAIQGITGSATRTIERCLHQIRKKYNDLNKD